MPQHMTELEAATNAASEFLSLPRTGRPTLHELYRQNLATIAEQKRQHAEAMRELHGDDRDFEYLDDIRQDAEYEALGDSKETE